MPPISTSPLARLLIAVALGCAGCTHTPSVQPTESATTTVARPFDADAAWTEFETTLREAYAYLDRTDFSVDAQLAHTATRARRARDAAQFRSILHRSTFAFTDPHFIIGPFDDDDPNVFPTSADLVVACRNGRYLIADVRIDSAADRAGIRPGWGLLAADGVPIDAAIEAIWGGLVVAKTEAQRAYAATLAANGRRAGERSLELAHDDGTTTTVALANPRTFANEVTARASLTVRREGNVGIVRIENSLGDKDLITAFDAAILELSDTESLVIDLRNTPSGGNTNNARAVIGHFVTEIRAYQVHEIPAIERATTVPRRFVEQVLPRAPHYSGRVAVLGGAWTGSMGEGLLIGLHAAAKARTFASDMGDLLGGLHNFSMTHSTARVDFGAERLLHVDGTPREDFVADVGLPSADRDDQGRDPAMAAALTWLNATHPGGTTTDAGAP